MFDIAYRFPGIYFFQPTNCCVFYAWFLLSSGFKARVYLSIYRWKSTPKKKRTRGQRQWNESIKYVVSDPLQWATACSFCAFNTKTQIKLPTISLNFTFTLIDICFCLSRGSFVNWQNKGKEKTSDRLNEIEVISWAYHKWPHWCSIFVKSEI